MTTLAYKQGVLAGDTLVTYGDAKLPGHERKVHKLRNGCLFGAAGIAAQIDILKEAVQKGQFDNPPMLKEVDALLVHPSGQCETYERGRWCQTNAPYAALGSGHDFAMAVMAFGGSAKDAVRIAIKLDKGSGGKVQSVSIKQKEKAIAAARTTTGLAGEFP
jgi:ATP-dependent protease HslVU (ClpYQ) peptidase subunit